jgi:hypothetical protein
MLTSSLSNLLRARVLDVLNEAARENSSPVKGGRTMYKFLEHRRCSMNAVQHTYTSRVSAIWLAVTMVLLAALSYICMSPELLLF